jgi:hypoxanthine phosphoribosyltransferase
MNRPEGPLRHEILTWEDVDKLIDILLPQLRAVGTFDGMIMITRGGVIPGGLLAEALGIVHLLTAAVDFPAAMQGVSGLLEWPHFLQFPDSALLLNRHILTVDDVWGSGRTSISVRERCLAAGATAHTCVLHFNPYRSLFATQQPDFYGAVTDSYIVYPWEVDRGLRGIAMNMPDMN